MENLNLEELQVSKIIMSAAISSSSNAPQPMSTKKKCKIWEVQEVVRTS